MQNYPGLHPGLSCPHRWISLNASSFPMLIAGRSTPSQTAWLATLTQYFQGLPCARLYNPNHLYVVDSFLPPSVVEQSSRTPGLFSGARPCHLRAPSPCNPAQVTELSGCQLTYLQNGHDTSTQLVRLFSEDLRNT